MSWYKNIVFLWLIVQWDHFFLPHKMFFCQTKTCWEITNWILSQPPSVPQLLSSTARAAMFRGLRGHSPPWGLYNSPVSLPPSHLGYHLCDGKQGPLRGAGDGAGRLPPQWTEISVMSQIWQTRSLYGGLAGAWPCCGLGTVEELTASLLIGPRCATWNPSQSPWLAQSLAGSTEDHMLWIWASSSQTDMLFGPSDICHPPAIWPTLLLQKNTHMFPHQLCYVSSVLHARVSLIP